jgi:hypothetical protein
MIRFVTFSEANAIPHWNAVESNKQTLNTTETILKTILFNIFPP